MGVRQIAAFVIDLDCSDSATATENVIDVSTFL